ncbi:pyridoxamine 5'-phosphate oxidase family protein [Erythrobacter sp. F6033]|uniref:pyridoxamine 5'-phosphate oxidase family protein n=1 Tax=Erythrobacter sp. F6033 TaxID=2926401 RepID=UPI001FF45C31|nr:pyridoxamine 5'-phosphate oxidase family protein [Erythrobacter sp. F6033]MCK0128763.1 pyridoxamine 5'-phosphate oxidase family protein [Erythrobacter sp. F6033]
MFDNLDTVREDMTYRLIRAGKDRKTPMHVPTVVTADVDARVMVLREFDPQAFTLRFHTDTRAPKVATIDADPRMAVLFYDQPEKVQIRVKGRGKILRDAPVTQAAWDASNNFARRCYLGDGPGSASDTPTSGLPPEFEGVEPTDEQVIAGRPNFSVLLIELDEIDWFYLAHTGHIRAQFTRDGDDWAGRWVSP